jgi:hypothetical protein
MTDLTGHTINQYHILAEIGRGGMATVYRAYQPAMGREVAVKILPHQFAHDPTFLARFEREVQIAARVQHPRILPVYDAGEHVGQPYIVMAYMPGGTLEDWIRASEGKGLPLDDALRIVSQVAEGLDALHSQGIVHRDLKPSNILLDEHGDCFLSDFGVAQLLEATAHLTGTGLVGTPGYMAPEAFQHGQTGASSDLYALGIIAWEMLAGRHPFEAETPAQWMRAHIEKAVPDIRRTRPDLPPDVNAVLQVATAKDPARRFANAGQMAAALRQAIAARPRPGKRPVRRPAWLWAVVGAGLVGVLALGLLGGLLLLGGSKAGADPTPTPPQPPTAAPATHEPTTTPSSQPADTPTAVVTSVSIPIIGGGTGILGFNANGFGYTIDVSCVLAGGVGCDPNPHILPVVGGVNPLFGYWTPDNTSLVFEASSGELSPTGLWLYTSAYVVNLADNSLIRLGQPERNSYSPSTSPDGTRIAYGSQGDIYVADLECAEYQDDICTLDEAQLVWDSATPIRHDVRWLPDNRLFVQECGYGESPITCLDFLINPDGSGWTQAPPELWGVTLADQTHYLRRVFVSICTEIIFNQWGGREACLLSTEVTLNLISIDGRTNQEVLTFATGTNFVGDGDFQVSPDRRYAVISMKPVYADDYEIYLLDLACLEADLRSCRDNLIRITDNNMDDGLPRWSPDGRWLAFIRARSLQIEDQGPDPNFPDYTVYELHRSDFDVYLIDVEMALQGRGEESITQLTHIGVVDWDSPVLWQPAPQP